MIRAAGINNNHGSSLCLVDDRGAPVFCVSEERFTRLKLQRGVPHRAFAYAASSYPLDGATLAVSRLDTRQRIRREIEYVRESVRSNLFHAPVHVRIGELSRLALKKRFMRTRELRRLSPDARSVGALGAVRGFDHHECHMASAFYCSGLNEAVVFSVDGVGDLVSAVVGRGNGANLTVSKRYFQSHQISGQAYEVVTAMLGFHPVRHPGKVTGLAAYSEPDPELVHELDAWFRAQYAPGSRDNWYYLIHRPDGERQLARLHELRATRFGNWTREEIASAIQNMLERDVIALIREHVPSPEGRNVVLAGGVFANVKLNQRLKELGFSQIFVQPAMADDGTGLGAAILAARQHAAFAPYRLTDVYLGPEFSADEMRSALEESGLAFEELRDGRLERRLAELLHDGHVAARFQGRMEFGPRALGNRSILCHAKDPAVNDWLNTQLGRSEFMPFAPVTLAAHGSECYEGLAGAEHAAEFMTITFKATAAMREQSPACVHVDGTARPQLVRREVNRSLHATLEHYRALSGIPSLINTSFNLHEEPIVCTPREAVSAFLEANLDVLAIGDFLALNPSASARARRQAAAVAR